MGCTAFLLGGGALTPPPSVRVQAAGAVVIVPRWRSSSHLYDFAWLFRPAAVKNSLQSMHWWGCVSVHSVDTPPGWWALAIIPVITINTRAIIMLADTALSPAIGSGGRSAGSNRGIMCG